MRSEQINPKLQPEAKNQPVDLKNQTRTVETKTNVKPTKPKKPKVSLLDRLFKNRHLSKNEKQELRKQKKLLKTNIRLVKKLNRPHPGSMYYKNTDDNIIELINVSKWYSNNFTVNNILKNINLKIKKGEFVVILGPSGSGKTTLLNIISGMDRASNGQVIVANHNLITMSHRQLTYFRKNNVGFVFQQYGLLPGLKIRENIDLGAQLQDDFRKRLDLDEIIEDLGILRHSLKFPKAISGGQQQRVAIARALVKNPEILFGDEPTGAVDEKTSKQILKMFCEVNQNYKTTIVIVTHNPIIADLATMVIKVDSGKISEIRIQKPKTVDELEWII